jgi:hypothetical protein
MWPIDFRITLKGYHPNYCSLVHIKVILVFSLIETLDGESQ